jgi:hypothetical protein
MAVPTHLTKHYAGEECWGHEGVWRGRHSQECEMANLGVMTGILARLQTHDLNMSQFLS